MLKFITSNKNKYEEIRVMLSPIKVERVNIELDEIQELDPQKVIKHKLRQALKYQKSNFFIEDSMVYFGCLNNKLPGPFIKWFQIH